VNREKGYGAIVMVNSDNDQIINEILRSIAREYKWEDYLPQPYDLVQLDSSRLDEYIGRFQVNPDRILTVTREGGRLYGEPTASPRVELFPISENEFVRTDADVRYTFVRGAGGKVSAMKLLFNGGTSDATRLSSDVLIPYEQLIAGKFAEAAEGYKKIQLEKPDNAAVAEGRLNSLAHYLLDEKKVAEAIALLKVNVELHPQSARAHESLGDACVTGGDRNLAIASYRKALELNPRNKSVADTLKKLER
jgi:tetratricopeptide (TPR) repeat protein